MNIWKLADFGIAQLLQYYAKTFAGTEVYMAPEVLNEEVDVERRYGTSADIWSQGAVMSFYCNGTHLFQYADDVAAWPGNNSPINCWASKTNIRI